MKKQYQTFSLELVTFCLPEDKDASYCVCTELDTDLSPIPNEFIARETHDIMDLTEYEESIPEPYVAGADVCRTKENESEIVLFIDSRVSDESIVIPMSDVKYKSETFSNAYYHSEFLWTFGIEDAPQTLLDAAINQKYSIIVPAVKIKTPEYSPEVVQHILPLINKCATQYRDKLYAIFHV